MACIGCKQMIEFPDVPQARVVNCPNASVILQEHAVQGMCPNCGPVLAAVQQVAIQLVAFPAPAEEQKPLIVVPTGFRLN